VKKTDTVVCKAFESILGIKVSEV